MSSCASPNSRDLTKLRRRREQQRQKAIGLVGKTTTLHVQQALLYISLPSMHDYDVHRPNFKVFKDKNSKAINSTVSVWSRVWPPLFSSNINSLLLSNQATWDNREMVERMRNLFFSEVFVEVAVVTDRKVPRLFSGGVRTENRRDGNRAYN